MSDFRSHGTLEVCQGGTEGTQLACRVTTDVPKVSPTRPRFGLFFGDVRTPTRPLSPTVASAKADSGDFVTHASGTFRAGCRFAGTFDADVKRAGRVSPLRPR